MKEGFITLLSITVLIIIIFFSCDPDDGEPPVSTATPIPTEISDVTPSPSPGPTSDPTPAPSPGPTPIGPIFTETFESVPDGTNIRPGSTDARTSTLDNPDSFLRSYISGTVTAGTAVSGSGAITLGSVRMAIIVPGLSDTTEPVLYITLKNDDGSGAAVANLTFHVGNEYTTNQPGRNSHGEYSITNTNYEVLTVNLNTSVLDENNLVQFRSYVGSNSAAGLHIHKIEIAESGYIPGPTSEPTPTPISTETPVPTETPIPTETPPPGIIDPELIGFASMNGGTNGGSAAIVNNDIANIVYVSTGTELQDAIDDRAANNTPRVIYVNGTITPENSPELSKIDIKGDSESKMYENISIIGIGYSGELNGIGIKIRRARNIIIRNLKIHHVLLGEKDCIGIEGPASNIWIDHCELYGEYDNVGKDYYDGLLDAKENCDYLTFSYNYFHDSWKASLVGRSDGDDYSRKITYHHNYFHYVNSRLPSYRFGEGHVFNNYYDTVFTGGVNSRMKATLRIEGNYFLNARDPIYSKDSPEEGYWDLGDGTVDSNVYDNCTWGDIQGTEYTNANILGFSDTCTYIPPYTYSLQIASEARDDILTNCGIGKIIDPD